MRGLHVPGNDCGSRQRELARVTVRQSRPMSGNVRREITITRLRDSSQVSLSSLRRVGRPPELRRSIGDWRGLRKANSCLYFIGWCAYAVLSAVLLRGPAPEGVRSNRGGCPSRRPGPPFGAPAQEEPPQSLPPACTADSQ